MLENNLSIYGSTQKYLTNPEIPESKKDTRKYPIVYFDTPTRPATWYFVQYPTRPDLILKNPTRWALAEWTLARNNLCPVGRKLQLFYFNCTVVADIAFIEITCAVVAFI